MLLRYLDASLFYGAVIHACHQIVGQQEALNAINIFPVPDGDTGNNMAGTAQAIINHAEIRPTLKLTCKSIADASILGARGNSGMIFSQFFNGLLEEPQWPEQLDTVKFAVIVGKAAVSVRASILNPVEGTILTVMDAWAKSLKQYAHQQDDFIECIKKTLPDVKAALAATSTMLEVLRQAHVVDAGAKGFSLFIEGFCAYLVNPTAIPEQNMVSHPTVLHEELEFQGSLPDKRYCTEAVIYGENINKEKIAKMIEHYGDSIVLTANRGLCRIHLHCNEPWFVFDKLKQIGSIRYPKVDDMVNQYKMVHQRKFKIALMTDTGADIPQALVDDYQIHFIPVNVHMEGHDLLDKYCINGQTFYDELALSKQYPVTSFPSLKQIEDKIRQVSHHYDEVLILTMAQTLSGTYEAICKTAKKYPNVHVVNTKHIAGSQGLLVNYAAELIADGFAISAIKEALQKKIPKTKLFVMIKHMDALMRSGRVGKLMGKISQFLGVKPMVTLNEQGKVISFDKSFSENKALSKLIETVKSTAKTQGGLENYGIVHAGTPEKAKEFAQWTTNAFGFEPAFIEPVTIGIGVHAGKGSVALAAMFS